MWPRTTYYTAAVPSTGANIEQIAREYLLGKNQQGAGRFCGKDIALQPDGSIKIDQEFYVKDKVVKNHLSSESRQQRYSKCTAAEIEQLRSQLGVLSWLSKETRCDLAGRVSLLQQSFPEPKISDMLEGNKIADEAVKHASLGDLGDAYSLEGLTHLSRDGRGLGKCQGRSLAGRTILMTTGRRPTRSGDATTYTREEPRFILERPRWTRPP